MLMISFDNAKIINICLIAKFFSNFFTATLHFLHFNKSYPVSPSMSKSAFVCVAHETIFVRPDRLIIDEPG